MGLLSKAELIAFIIFLSLSVFKSVLPTWPGSSLRAQCSHCCVTHSVKLKMVNLFDIGWMNDRKKITVSMIESVLIGCASDGSVGVYYTKCLALLYIKCGFFSCPVKLYFLFVFLLPPLESWLSCSVPCVRIQCDSSLAVVRLVLGQITGFS